MLRSCVTKGITVFSHLGFKAPDLCPPPPPRSDTSQLKTKLEYLSFPHSEAKLKTGISLCEQQAAFQKKVHEGIYFVSVCLMETGCVWVYVCVCVGGSERVGGRRWVAPVLKAQFTQLEEPGFSTRVKKVNFETKQSPLWLRWQCTSLPTAETQAL